MNLLLEQEVKSRFYSSISLRNSGICSHWDEWSKPQYFLNSTTTKFLLDKIVIKDKNIVTDINYDFAGSIDFSLSGECANLFTYEDIGIILTYEQKGFADKNTPFFLSENLLQRYNEIIGDNINKVEDVVFKGTDREGINSVWWYPALFVPVTGVNDNPEFWIDANAPFLLDNSIFDKIQYPNALGFVGWDFAIFFYDHTESEIIDIIDFYLKIAALEWHTLTETSGRIIDLITDRKNSSSSKIDICYDIYKNFFFSLSMLDKNILSYAEPDITLLSSLANKWESTDFAERVSEKVDKMNQLYLYETGKIEKEDADYLNRTVFIIAIIGIAGTVAGIISTIDFSNMAFNSYLRIWIIIWSTLISGIFFGYFLPGLFKKLTGLRRRFNK